MIPRTFCRAALELLLPAGPCVRCGADSRMGPAPGICRTCWGARRRPGALVCASCGFPFPAGGSVEEGAICGSCLKDPPAYHSHRAAFRYEGPVRDLLLLFKDNHRYPLAKILGRAVSRLAHASWPDVRFDRVIPVPGVFSRRLNRGFEPASLAAREAARAMGVPFSRVLTLKRTPSPQKGLTAVQRRDNLRGVFGVKARTLADMRVLLVDDVTTTGTTLREAATVLAKAGAEVYAATVAMTPERALDMGMDVDDPRVGVNSPARGTA